MGGEIFETVAMAAENLPTVTPDGSLSVPPTSPRVIFAEACIGVALLMIGGEMLEKSVRKLKLLPEGPRQLEGEPLFSTAIEPAGETGDCLDCGSS